MLHLFKQNILTFLSLFTSIGTLVCCALPALFVTLGMGAVFVGMVSTFPQLIWLSENKFWLFLFGFLLIFFSGVLLYRARNMPCPVDPAQARICTQSRRLSVLILKISCVLYVIGFCFAYILPFLI